MLAVHIYSSFTVIISWHFYKIVKNRKNEHTCQLKNINESRFSSLNQWYCIDFKNEIG
jgi:hypothetical protein